MARKSRRTDAPATAPAARAKVCRMGVYARTSKSYGDDGSSIENQKRIVADHIGRLPDAVVAGYYVDDGATGTNQDREAFQRMVGDLRAGRIAGVAAKDASRLGATTSSARPSSGRPCPRSAPGSSSWRTGWTARTARPPTGSGWTLRAS